MNNKENKNIVIAIAAIAIIISIVGGATFAYWQWISAENTTVNVTVAQSIKLTITPETVTKVVGDSILRPTNVVTNTIEEYDSSQSKYNQTNEAVLISYAQVKVENQTGIKARPKFKLKLKINKGVQGTGDNITATYADKIHYAVVEGGAISGLTGPVNGTTGSWVAEGDCDSPIATGVFSKTEVTSAYSSSTDKWYNSPYITNVGTESPIPFPKLTATDNTSVTFEAAPYTTTFHRYKVCIWLDKDYTFTNVGQSILDPLQSAEVTVSWSEDSEVIQVTG